jgi:glycosyltransferase involved in cell wall biosynthesis
MTCERLDPAICAVAEKIEKKKCRMIWNSRFTDRRKVAFLSTYIPRKCGIAVFTKDLAQNLDLTGDFAPAAVIAMKKKDGTEHYGPRVAWQIVKEDEGDYVEVANQVNMSNVDVVNIQHEFGIFGGKWGSYLLSFLDSIRKPVVTTLHTVQPNFEPEALTILKEIVSRSEAVVVTGRTAANILAQYGIPTEKLRIIHHGCPNVPFVFSETVKPLLNLTGRIVLCTFGLLGRGKGIEYAIRALPEIVKEYPDVLYLVIGETHPEVKMSDDESYRKQLVGLVNELGLQGHVEFQDRFLTKPELIRYLQATDVYLTPYLGKNQISSGTLVYALGTGRAVVSTPYLHAEEVLAGGRGMLCEFQNSSSIAAAVNRILADKQLKAEMERKAYQYSRKFTWPEVAKKYARLFKWIMDNHQEALSVELSSHYA